MAVTVVAASAPSSAPTEPVRGRSRGTSRWRLAVSSRVYLPACLVAALAVVLVGIAWYGRFGGEGLVASMSSLRVIVSGPATLVIIGVFLVAERVRPAQRRPLVARGHRHDVLFAVLNATLVVPLVTARALAPMDLTNSS